jgi:hypothetical protein
MRGRLDEELSFAAAAAELGRHRDPKGRKLRNMVVARERQTGKQIAIRLAGAKEPKLRISIGALFRAFPELAPARVEDLARLVRPMLDRAEARTRIVVREEIAKDVLPRIVFLEEESGIVRRCLEDLDKLKRRELTGTARPRPSR